jgi:hypothetical protein
MKRVALVALALLAPCSALAQRAPDKIVYKRTTVITFGGEGIRGTTEGPGMEVVFSPPKTTFPTLVKVRTSFAAEILRSVDEL